ncbi:MAG: transcription-repair coupling factor [Treponema sp.]|nr:transcription-repair coupling factor [Treponema sp.]
MKEVLWTEELCARLETLLAREDSEGIENGFAAYDRARTDSGSKTGAGFVAQETQAGLENDTHLEVSLAAEADTAGSCVKNDTDSDFFYEGRGDSLQKSTYSRCLDGAASSNAGGAVCQSASTGTETSQKAVHLSLTEHAKKERDRLLLELLELGESEGEELFYGLLWDTKSSVLDYAKNSTVMFFDFDRLCNAEQLLRNEFAVSYRTVRQRLPVLSPREMLLDFSRIVSGCRNAIRLRTLETEEATQDPVAPCSGTDEAPLFASSSGNAPPPKVKAGTVPHVFRMQSEPGQSYFGNINYLKEQLVSLQKDGWHIFVFADNPNQALRIREVLKDVASDFEDGTFPAQVLPTAISEGFSVSGQKILVIQENEIFGRRKAVPKSSRRAKSRAIDTFVDLNPGDFVVHVQYGIGCFKGIERVKANGTERDYIKLLYAEDETVFIPIEQVNMVQRYIGSEKEHPRLDRIGSKSWSARKAKVQKKAEEMAARLVDLYSKRKASRGFPFPKDSEWQAAFEAAFPYEDTPDQLTATEDIKADMERPVPMDRLVCGDVGYGKTEIAMRAAFKAVMGGKQVAFLAPTTILAEQHFETCTERFKNFPVSVAQLSRFVSQAEQKKTLAKLASGEVDILIGTHRILQKDVVFKDLGLMIVDEEQRFGVKDKERLKALKTNIDSLAMSATPIPRTLHMSLLKIRDMSLLTTPPQNRQSIETVIEGYDGERVARAIRSEVGRGGQVFFLHNRVETLEETRHSLEQLVPEMLIDVAHGQMGADELDDIFRRFKMGGFHVLVATTIIENGIDIPNVNTIIIDRADMYGVSQLYQLRGRVGRSDRKAYAYLFYPENKALSEVAMKRLQVISDFTELGSGFKIAMKDMEIRGAGNLLGRDQSGDVYAVGFEMYLNLLNAAIERLVDENWHAPDEVLLELEYTGFIPDSYVSGAETKMEIYKKIAAIQSDDELSSMYAELYDRFGPIPGEAESLLDLAKIRIICHKLSISTLREKNGVVQVEFSEVAKVNVDKVLGLIKTSAGRVRLDPAHPNRLLMQTGPVDLSSKSGFIREKLSRLA